MQLPKGIKIIDSKNKGPLIGILARIHGNETSGTHAHKLIIDHFKKNPLKKGKIYLITGNLKAAKKNKRAIKYDLNRLFLPPSDPFIKRKNPHSYEIKRAQELSPIIKKLDCIIDFHSTSKPSTPFALYFHSNEKTQNLVKKLPIRYCFDNMKDYIKGTTLSISKKNSIAIAIECGKHTNKKVRDTAEKAIKIILNELKLTDFKQKLPRKKPVPLKILEVEHIKDYKTFKYKNRYINFSPLQPKEIIATDNSQNYIAPDKENLRILFPASKKSIRAGTNRDAYYICQTT